MHKRIDGKEQVDPDVARDFGRIQVISEDVPPSAIPHENARVATSGSMVVDGPSAMWYTFLSVRHDFRRSGTSSEKDSCHGKQHPRRVVKGLVSTKSACGPILSKAKQQSKRVTA